VPDLVAELARRQIAVFAIGGNAAALAAKATTTIHIVFIVNEDPVRLGLVASLAKPGGSLTGVNFLAGELTAKRLGLLREFVPTATRVAVLVNPANATTAASTLRDVAPAARALGLQIRVLETSTSREIDAAFDTFVRERPDALFVDPDPFFLSRRVQLVHLATRHALPASGDAPWRDLPMLQSMASGLRTARMRKKPMLLVTRQRRSNQNRELLRHPEALRAPGLGVGRMQ
jgi:ABC-type uncharacterized transport system substrate-binding protein